MQMFGLGGGGSQFSVEEITGQPDDQVGGKPVPRDLNVADFDSFGGMLQPGKNIEIATLRIDADTKIRWGYGSSARPENQGYLYVDLQSPTPNPVEAILSLFVESPTRRTSHFVRSFDTERLDASKTDRQQMVPLPLQSEFIASEDAYVVLYADGKSGNTDQDVDSSNSEVIIPATEYDLSN